MFKEELIIAGFGGQGVLSMGKILAYSGVVQGLEVTWMPSYGPEMRGGTANVTVILSDERISSPIAHDYDTAVILNQQSMDKFEPKVKPGGVLIYDPNGIVRPLAERYSRLFDRRDDRSGPAGQYPGFQHNDFGRLSEGSASRHARKRVCGTSQIVARTDGPSVACQRSGHASRDGDYPARYGLTIAESSCCGKRGADRSGKSASLLIYVT